MQLSSQSVSAEPSLEVAVRLRKLEGDAAELSEVSSPSLETQTPTSTTFLDLLQCSSPLTLLQSTATTLLGLKLQT